MKRNKSWSQTFKFMSFICFLTVLILLLLLRIFNTERFLDWYARYTDSLVRFEVWIENYGATPLTVAIILLNYTLKAFIPWFPVSCICVSSAVLFKWYYALAINLTGLAILFMLKFFWGRLYGGGNAEKLLMKYDSAHRFVEEGKHGSAVVLFLARLLPSIPINSVSCLYGATAMSPIKYLIISELGFLYKAVTYIIIGRNVFDPASTSFIVPFIPLILFSGMIFLSLSGAFGGVEEHKKQTNK